MTVSCVALFACGEIVDQVIVQNSIRARGQRYIRREKKPRQTVLRVPAYSWPA